MASASRGPRSSRGGSPAVGWFAALAVAVLVAGGGLAVLAKLERSRGKGPLQAEPSAIRPFDDLPPEAPPPRRSGSAVGEQPFGAPGDLIADPVWQGAVKLANEGEALYQLAVEAKARGDVPELNALGNEAKRKFDQALESTAALEEALSAARGETDSVVRDVQLARNGWFDRVRWLHKSTGR